MNIEIIGIGEGAQEHAKELKEKLEGLLKGRDNSKRAKVLAGNLVHKMMIEEEIDPRSIMTALLGMSAVVARCYCKPRQDVDPRKAFRKMAGLAWDVAEDVKEKVELSK